MPKPKVQARLPQNVYEQVESFAEEHDISQSEATRQLIESGLQHEQLDRLAVNTDARIIGGAVLTGILIGVILIIFV